MRFLGCKVSYADARAVHERLLADGHVEVADGGEIAVVNTCCVTHEAVSKSRQAVSRASRRHAACVRHRVRREPRRLVPRHGRKRHRSPEARRGCGDRDRRRRRRDRLRPAAAPPERTRAFVKIQDGCSFSCAFCVIPLVRGGTRSRRARAVLEEIRRRVGQGHREIVLTGVNLGCFRDREAGYTLERLVREAGALPGVERLRLSSIEVNHLGPRLVAALRETPTAAKHLHVPLQSGDDRVLRAMKRRYGSAQYLAKLEGLDDFNLTTDVIVGFPGEDERAFERTLAVVGSAGITKVHVFPYSPRPGTATAAADTVPPAVKKDRSARLRALSDERCRERWGAKVGTTDLVLVDRPGRGYGEDYSPWLVDAPVGEFVHARAVGLAEEGILAVAA